MATTQKRASKPKTGDAKRTALKTKVHAAQKRNKERSLTDYAVEARDGATSFVKEHPITTVLGGLALGALVASLLPGPGRRLRKKASARSAVLAGTLADLALTYGTQFLDGAGKAARSGQDRLGDLGEILGDSARGAKREAGNAGDSARDFTREAGKAAVRALRDLRSRVTH